jgi:uncharacterized protein (TIGR02117 family)
VTTRFSIVPIAVLAAVLGCLSACAVSSPYDQRTARAEPTHSIYVVRRAWHTGIAVAASDWPDRRSALLAEFPDARWLEFGWGDAVYYQAEEKTIGMTLAAVFWPTDSVMEVLSLQHVRAGPGPDYESVEIHVSADELRALAAGIERSFAGETLRPTGKMILTVEGPRRFYHAEGRFHFFRMCNHWTAQRLKAAGCSIRPVPVITASRVLSEARRCAGRAP